MNEIPPWSFSSLGAFETCPKRYYLTRVTKLVKEPPTEATIWGNEVHTALENRLKDKTPLPTGMARYEKHCLSIERTPGEIFTERQYALTKKLSPTGWWDEDAWCRGIIDVGVINGDKAVLLDWKTGKVKPNSAQLQLFAAFVFHSNPEINVISTGFVWLKDDKITSERFVRDDLAAIWGEYIPRVKRMELAYKDDRWEPKPSGLCKNYCPVGKELCSFCGK